VIGQSVAHNNIEGMWSDNALFYKAIGHIFVL
jgi:hypothetical protein